MKFRVESNNFVILVDNRVDQHLTCGGPQEMDSFENIISPLVLNMDNFYLCRKKGKVIQFAIKIQIISCFKDIAPIQ